MNRKTVQICCMVLLLLQVIGLSNMFFLHGRDARTGFMLLMLAGGFILWFVMLMIFTFLIWYMGNERTVKKDMGALVVIALLTFVSLGLLLVKLHFI